MYVTVVVVIAALIAAAGVWVSARRPGGPDPLDPEAEERWLVRWLIGHPIFGPTALRIHRRSIGGLMLVVALAVTFASALVVGLLFDMVDRNSGLARWDRAVADWGSRNATARSTDVLNVLTDLGGSAYLIVIGAVVALGDYVRRRSADVPAFLFTVLAGVLVINNGLKWIVDRERPDVDHLAGASGSSFPSGHSAAAAAAWCALALVVTRRWPRRGRGCGSRRGDDGGARRGRIVGRCWGCTGSRT